MPPPPDQPPRPAQSDPGEESEDSSEPEPGMIRQAMRAVFGPLAASVGGLSIAEDTFSDTLTTRLNALRNQLGRLVFFQRVCVAGGLLGVLLALIGLALWLSGAPGQPHVLVVMGLVGAVVFFLLQAVLFNTRELSDRIEEYELWMIVEASPYGSPMRAYDMFEAHKEALERYYRLALKQSRTMLGTGLLCIAFGVAVVIGAALIVLQEDDTAAQIAVAAVGALEGILVSYVASIYLRMHAAAAQTLNDFHTRLVSTHHIIIGNYLATRIEDAATREKTLEAMAIELARQ